MMAMDPNRLCPRANLVFSATGRPKQPTRHRIRWFDRCGPTFAGFLVAWLLPTAGLASVLDEFIPDGFIADYLYLPESQPGDGPAGRSTSTLLTGLVDSARQFGMFSLSDPEVRWWIDLTAAFLSVVEFPHAMVLLDFAVEPMPGEGFRLSRVEAGLVLQVGPHAGKVESQIQRLLNLHTNIEQTTLTKESVEGTEVQILRDRRLPDWATVSAARAGDFYLVAVGETAMQKMLAARAGRSGSAQGGTTWPAIRRAGSDTDPLWSLRVDFLRLRRNKEPEFVARTHAVLDALQLKNVDRAAWSVRYDGRAVLASAVTETSGKVSASHFADRTFRGLPADRFVPSAAGSFALLDCNVAGILRSAVGAYLATEGESYRAAAERFLRDLERDADVSLQREILNRLGSCVVIHDVPRHGLRLPLLWTVQLRIEGDGATFRSSLDRLLAALQTRITEPSFVRLNREADGIWFLSMGIAGPAIAIVDGWAVLSFSPYAARQAVAALLAIESEK